MAFFLPPGFSAGFRLRRASSTPHRKPLPAIASRSDEAGGLVRLVEYINKNQDVKSRSLAGSNEKNSHL